jgi:hypothetical protein
VALVVVIAMVIAIAITLHLAQATTLPSTTTDTALRPPVVVVNGLPTGPQHSQGPHPNVPARSPDIGHEAEG